MKRTGSFLFCLALSATASADASVSPEEIRRAVAKDGAPAVAAHLFRRQSVWDATISGVGSGDHQWVAVGVSLLSGADGGAASELHDALFAALAHDPDFVLRQPPSRNFDAIEICAGRHDPLATYDEASAEQLTARGKVAGLGADLAHQRELCLTALDSGLTDIRRFFGVKAK